MKKILIYFLPVLLCVAAIDSKTLLEQGMDAFKSGNYGSAELVFKKIKESEEIQNLDQAWFYLSLSIYHRKKYESALVEFNNFLNRCTTDAYAIESRFWLGECHNNLADFTNAIEEYRRFISSSKDRGLVPVAHDRIAGIYLANKRYAEAILEWESAVSKSDDSGRNELRRLWIGDAHFSNGRFDEALDVLFLVSTSKTDIKISSMARILSGRIYQAKNEHKRALALLEGIPDQLAAGEPFNEALFFKAISYIHLGEALKAGPLLKRFLATGEKSPFYYEALYQYGKLLVQGTERDSGLAMLERVRAEYKGTELKAKASMLIGTLYANEQPEKAILFLKESLKQATPDNRSELLVLLGKTCMRAKKYDEAFEFFDLFLKENPFDKARDEVYFSKAQIFLEKGNSDSAVDLFETIRKENPFSRFNTESGFYLGLIEYKKGNLDRAISLLKDYLKQKRPEMAYDAHVLITRIFISKGDMVEAGRKVNTLTREFMDRRGVEVTLKDYAFALRKRGLDAQKSFTLIIAKFPDSETAAELMCMLGNENFEKGNREEALRYYDGCLADKFNKEKGEAFYKRLELLYRMKRYDEVIGTVKKGNFPPMNEIQWMSIPLIQARSYYNLKKYDEVYMLLDQKNMGKYPISDILMYVKCALLVGDYRSAMEAADHLELSREEYSESLYAIGDYFLRNDNTDQAELFFSRAINSCPGTRYADYARISMGEAYARNKKYELAVDILSQAGAEGMQNRKLALLISCYFEMNQDEKAAALTGEHLQTILAGESAKEIIRRNFEYYFRKRDLAQFERYAKYLGKFPETDLLINYLSAKIYFDKRNYRKSYNYFNALAKSGNRYQGEALYHLGLHDLLINGKAPYAAIYFSRLAGMRDADHGYRLKAMIHLAIIYKESKNEDKSKAYLKEVLLNKDRGLYQIQADNLSEAFGYTGM